MKIDPLRTIETVLQDVLGVEVIDTVPPFDRTNSTFLLLTELPPSDPSVPGHIERVTVSIEAWVGDGDPATRTTRCTALATSARDALWAAWATPGAGRPTPHGAVAYVRSAGRPLLLPSGLDGVSRASLTVRVSIRRTRTPDPA